MSNETDNAASAKAVKAIEEGLRGNRDLLAVCRTLVLLRQDLPNLDEESMMTVVAVESELDDIPDPEQYATWNQLALKEKIAEKNEYLERVRASLKDALEKLLQGLT